MADIKGGNDSFMARAKNKKKRERERERERERDRLPLAAASQNISRWSDQLEKEESFCTLSCGV
jgi:hypothetical protein